MDMIKPHSKPREFTYRSGFVLQALGFFLLLLSPDASRLDIFLTAAGCLLITAGVLLSGWLLQVYMYQVRIIILASALLGTLLQGAAAFGAAYLGPVGLGFVFVGSCGLAGKEAFCFKLREGWYLMPVLMLLTFVLFYQHLTGSLMWLSRIACILAFFLTASLAGRKLYQPYAKCQVQLQTNKENA